MKGNTIILMFFVLLFSCKKDNFITEYYPNGNLKIKIEKNENNIPNGKYEEYYESGGLKVKTSYCKGNICDTLYLYYNNGMLKEKGLMFNNNLRHKWWISFDSLGILKQKTEYKVIDDESKLNQNINFFINGDIDYETSWFFTIDINDTLKLGKNVGKVNYYSKLKGDRKFLKVIINNEYSDSEIKKDTFSEEPNYSRFGVYAHKKGLKKINGVILEKIITTKEINNDSTSLIIDEYKKYFEKEVFIKD